MKAWQLTTINQPLELVELPDPVPAAGEIVVDPVVTGLCHSDVAYQDGTLGPLPLPLVLGHEIAGVVSAVGDDVTKFAIGDRVAIRAGAETPGTSMDGGFADKVLTPVEFVTRIPEGVSFEFAAVGTDAGLTSYHAVRVVGEVTAGMKVGIIGLGGLGYFGAQEAAGLGARVYAAEPNEAAQAAAAEFGYERISADITDFVGEDLDVIVDFAGFGTTTAGALAAVKPGGRVVQVGLGRVESLIRTDLLVQKQIHLVGSVAGTIEDLDEVLSMIGEGKLKPLISTIGFDDVPEGLARLARGEVRGRLVAQVNQG
ncbi:MAG: alcohol dehydrogenase [Frondihabitans sp.]|nr:alcohol dehydrogenase [Frondihabitans sp.]